VDRSTGGRQRRAGRRIRGGLRRADSCFRCRATIQSDRRPLGAVCYLLDHPRAAASSGDAEDGTLMYAGEVLMEQGLGFIDYDLDALPRTQTLAQYELRHDVGRRPRWAADGMQIKHSCSGRPFRFLRRRVRTTSAEQGPADDRASCRMIFAVSDADPLRDSGRAHPRGRASA
jgi:hypothetical protein